MNKWFSRFANQASAVTGSSWAFLAAAAIILIWAVTGPMFNFSDTWQLVINTGTTIITFLMVFLIQNTQNRDAKAIHLKLDEIIHVLGAAHNELIDVEDRTDEELAELMQIYRELAKQKHHQGDKDALLAAVFAAREEVEEQARSNGAGGTVQGADPRETVRTIEAGAALREVKQRQ
ncbi:MAG TPA: low affinity iron permease family protein [Chloroflexia bacterium]|nr:low affinity iron permease family protein [Chloroflexia bacterium]